jgi:hypothetical protein
MGVGLALVPAQYLRPHWLLAWGGAIAFAGLALYRRRVDFWQAVFGTFVVIYLGPLLAVAMIENYGFRMIVPAMPAALLLAVYVAEQVGHGITGVPHVPASSPASP